MALQTEYCNVEICCLFDSYLLIFYILEPQWQDPYVKFLMHQDGHYKRVCSAWNSRRQLHGIKEKDI